MRYFSILYILTDISTLEETGVAVYRFYSFLEDLFIFHRWQQSSAQSVLLDAKFEHYGNVQVWSLYLGCWEPLNPSSGCRLRSANQYCLNNSCMASRVWFAHFSISK